MGSYLTTKPAQCQVVLSPRAINGDSSWRGGLPTFAAPVIFDMYNFNQLYPGYISVPYQCRPQNPQPTPQQPPPQQPPPAEGETTPPPGTGPEGPVTGDPPDPPPEDCGPSMILPDDDHYYKQDQKDKYAGTDLDQLVQPIGGAFTALGIYQNDDITKTEDFSVDIRETKAGTAVDVFHEAQGKGILLFHAAMLEDTMLHGNETNPDGRMPTKVPAQTLMFYNTVNGNGEDPKSYLAFGTPLKGELTPADGGYFDLDVEVGSEIKGWLKYFGTKANGDHEPENGLSIQSHFHLQPNILHENPFTGLITLDTDDNDWLKFHAQGEWQKVWTDNYGHPNPHRLAVGSNAAPAYSFKDEPTMGMWVEQDTIDRLWFNTADGQIMALQPKGLELDGYIHLDEVGNLPDPTSDKGILGMQDGTPNTLEFKDDGEGQVYVGVRHQIFKAWLDTDQAGVANATWAKVELNREVFDLEGVFDATTNNRFQPTVAGYYQINWNLEFSLQDPDSKSEVNPYSVGAPTAMMFKSALYINGSRKDDGSTDSFNKVSDTWDELPQSHGSAVVHLNGTTDYVELYGFAQNTGPLPSIFKAGGAQTYMSGYLINKK